MNEILKLYFEYIMIIIIIIFLNHGVEATQTPTKMIVICLPNLRIAKLVDETGTVASVNCTHVKI